MALSTLPLEILDEILQYLDGSSLVACSTLARIFREPTQQRIFAKIIPTRSRDDPWAQQVLQPLVHSHRLASYVRELEIGVHDCTKTPYRFFLHALPFMTKLERLDVAGNIPLSCPMFRSEMNFSKLSSAKTLRLSSFTQVPFELLDLFPDVRWLTLDKVGFHRYTPLNGRRGNVIAPQALVIEPGSADDLGTFLAWTIHDGPSQRFSIANLRTFSIDMVLGCGSVLYERSFDAFAHLHSFLLACAPTLEELQIMFSYHTEPLLRLFDDKPIVLSRLRHLSLVFPVFWDPIPNGVLSNDVLGVDWVKAFTRSKVPEKLDIHIDLATIVNYSTEGRSTIPLLDTLLDLQTYLMKLEPLPMTSLGVSVDGLSDSEEEGECQFIPVVHKLLVDLVMSGRFEAFRANRPTVWTDSSFYG